MEQEAARKKPGFNFDEAKVPPHELPELLGRAVKTARQWERTRRPELLELFRAHVYGRPPGRPVRVRFATVHTDAAALDGKATLERVRITASDRGKSFSFEASLLLPNGSRGKAPAFVLINNRRPDSADATGRERSEFWPVEALIARGYATAVFHTRDVDPDEPGDAARARGVRGVWQGPGKAGQDAWGTISAWAWGVSRVMDLLASEPRVDGTRVAVVGHSRGGKAALWAGAQDPRFALVVSNNSGAVGAALGRRRYGETVGAINRSFPHWFCDNFKAWNDKDEQLPVDQHQLLALVAPRALYVTSADEDLWADPRGEFLGLAHASPAHALYGNGKIEPDEMPALERPLVRGRLGYHVRRGGHGLGLYDWERFMDFADHLWGPPAVSAR